MAYVRCNPCGTASRGRLGFLPTRDPLTGQFTVIPTGTKSLFSNVWLPSSPAPEGTTEAIAAAGKLTQDLFARSVESAPSSPTEPSPTQSIDTSVSAPSDDVSSPNTIDASRDNDGRTTAVPSVPIGPTGPALQYGGGGGGGGVTVTVDGGGGGAPEPAESEGRGFGIQEAALGALLAAVLGAAWNRGRK